MGFKDFVAERLKALDRTPTEAARVAGLSRDFFLDILNDKKSNVNAANLPKVARGLDLSPGEIAEAQYADAPGVPPRVPENRPVLRGDVPYDPRTMPRDLPVFATAAGAGVGSFSGFALERNKVVDHVRRPPALAASSDAYAIYVTDASMAPMHPPGELRFVHPHRPVRPGDTVVIIVKVEQNGPEQAFLKLLVGRNGDDVVARQINPETVHTFAARTVVAVHRVLTMNELFEA